MSCSRPPSNLPVDLEMRYLSASPDLNIGFKSPSSSWFITAEETICCVEFAWISFWFRWDPNYSMLLDPLSLPCLPPLSSIRSDWSDPECSSITFWPFVDWLLSWRDSVIVAYSKIFVKVNLKFRLFYPSWSPPLIVGSLELRAAYCFFISSSILICLMPRTLKGTLNILFMPLLSPARPPLGLKTAAWSVWAISCESWMFSIYPSISSS